MAEVSGVRDRGRPKFCWMEGVKLALGNRGLAVEAGRNIGTSREPWSIMLLIVSRGHFCLVLCSFGPPSHALVVITWRGVGCRYLMRFGETAKRMRLVKI